jgi:dihydrofolate reductase
LVSIALHPRLQVFRHIVGCFGKRTAVGITQNHRAGLGTTHNDEALALAAKYPRTLVIGGASIYRQFLPFMDLVHVTKIDLAPASDSFFENLDASPDFRIREAGERQEENGVRYQFVTYERIL